MADDLRSLRDRLRRTLEQSVPELLQDAKESDFVKILGAVGALETLAQQLVEMDKRVVMLERTGAKGPAAQALAGRLQELKAKRRKLIDSMNTLTREMAR